MILAVERYFLSFRHVENPEERFFMMRLNKSSGIDFSKLYSMDDSLDFTDDEIREELCKLGYSSVPDTKLEEFKKGIVYSRKDTEEISLSRNSKFWLVSEAESVSV